MKKFRGFLCGFLAASILFLCVPAVAETIQAVFNAMIINVDGKQVNEKGQNYTLHNGDEVPFSLVYKGTTYLPLRKLVEVIGKDLIFDGTTSTVYIKDKATPAPTTTPTPSENDILYEQFIEQFTIVRTQITASNEILYDANYNGNNTQSEFWDYWSSIDSNLKKLFSEKFASEIQSKNPNYIAALDFKYKGTKLGYAFAYTGGYQVSSFLANPFNIHTNIN